MKPKKLLLIVVGAVLGLVLISNLIFSPRKAERPTSGVILSRAEIAEQCQKSAEKSFPDHCQTAYDSEEKLLTISVWIDDADYAATYAMIGTTGTREAWGDMIQALTEASGSWYRRFVDYGYTDVTVKMNLLNPSNLDNTLAQAINGDLIFDVVRDRP